MQTSRGVRGLSYTLVTPANHYPSRLPAFGLYFWHAGNVKLENVSLTTRAADQREAIVLEDANNVTVDNRLLRDD